MIDIALSQSKYKDIDSPEIISSGDNVAIYLREIGRIKLLTIEQEQQLASLIERKNYLACLEEKKRTPGEVVLAAAKEFVAAGDAFEAISVYCGLDPKETIYQKATSPLLYQNTFCCLHPDLLASVSSRTRSESPEGKVSQLSLSTQIICWPLIREFAQGKTVADFCASIESDQFWKLLEDHPQEISQHFSRIKKEAEEAKTNLITANLRLVVKWSKKYQGLGLSLPDLIQDGNIGLIRSTEKYNPRLGYKFSTYATWWIKQSIEHALTKEGKAIRIPVYAHDKQLKLFKISNALYQEHGRNPTEEEILIAAHSSGINTSDQLLKLLLTDNSVYHPLSLDDELKGKLYSIENHMTLGATIEDRNTPSPEDVALKNVRQEGIWNILNRFLKPREKRIIELRFGIEGGRKHTLEEIGEIYGLTRERVRQIEATSLRKLKFPQAQRELSKYL
ncbi:MAG: RNA polymerase sigma factor RpoD/SigA [Candidatus Paceibacterota bacterium]